MRIVGTAPALIIGASIRRATVIWAATIGLVHLRWVGTVLLLLVVGWQRSSVRLRRLLTVIRIRNGLISVYRRARALFDSALIPRHRSGGISPGHTGRRLVGLVGLIRLVGAIVRELIAIALCNRELIGVLRTTPIRALMRRSGYDSASRQRPRWRCMADRRCDRGRSRPGSDLLPALIDQHRPFDLCRDVGDRARDDGTLGRCNRRLRNGPYLLGLSRIDSYCDITHATARSEIIPAHGCDMGPVYVVDVCNVGDVHHVHVGSLDVHAPGLTDVCDIHLIDVTRAATVPRSIGLSGT